MELKGIGTEELLAEVDALKERVHRLETFAENVMAALKGARDSAPPMFRGMLPEIPSYEDLTTPRVEKV